MISIFNFVFIIFIFFSSGCNLKKDDLSTLLKTPAKWEKINPEKCNLILQCNTIAIEKRLQAAIGLKIKGRKFNKHLFTIPDINSITRVEVAFWSGVYLAIFGENVVDADKYFVLSIVMDPNYFKTYSSLVKKLCPEVYSAISHALNFALHVRNGEDVLWDSKLQYNTKETYKNIYDFYKSTYYLQKGEYELAKKGFDSLNMSCLFSYIADAYWNVNKEKEATEFYKKAIKSGDRNAFFMLSLLYLSYKRFAEAEDISRNAIVYDAKNRFLLLESLRNQKKITLCEGKKIIGSISREESNIFLICYILGIFYQDQGDITEAIVWYEKADFLEEGRDIRPLKKLLALYKKIGDLSKIKEIEKRILKLNTKKLN